MSRGGRRPGGSRALLDHVSGLPTSEAEPVLSASFPFFGSQRCQVTNQADRARGVLVGSR